MRHVETRPKMPRLRVFVFIFYVYRVRDGCRCVRVWQTTTFAGAFFVQQRFDWRASSALT